MEFYKKTLSPNSVAYGVTVPMWLAVTVAVALVIGVVLMLTVFFVWWMNGRWREAAE